MATKNKGGRPPRAPGEKMTRLSVMLRPIYREALDLLAREQRTSISQALENLLAQALRSKKIDEKPLLEVAQGMVWNSPDSFSGRLYRIRNQPFKTPDEQHGFDVLTILRDDLGPNELSEMLSYEPPKHLLLDMIDETYKMGSPPDFCAQMFIEAIRHGEKGRGTSHFTDSAGIEYIYDLDDYFTYDPNPPTKK